MAFPIPVFCGFRRIGELAAPPSGWPELRPFYEFGRAPLRPAKAYVVRLADGSHALQVDDETALLRVPGFRLLAGDRVQTAPRARGRAGTAG